jgi:hypothetical protein
VLLIVVDQAKKLPLSSSKGLMLTSSPEHLVEVINGTRTWCGHRVFAPQPGQDHCPGRMKPATTIDPATSPAGTADRHHPGDLFQVLAARIG